MPRSSLTLLLAAGLTAVGLTALSCSSDPETSAGQEALRQVKRAVPGTEFRARVERVRSRAGYIAATITSGDRGTQTFLFPPSETCEQVLEPERTLTLANLGTYGQFSDAEGNRCDPVGTLSLVEWRSGRRTTRSGLGGSPRPRAQANYRLLHRDDEYAFLHGRFPLAGAVGVVGGEDLVAAVRNVPECSQAIERTTTSMEYLERPPFLVLLSNGRCPIVGLATPLPSHRR